MTGRRRWGPEWVHGSIALCLTLLLLVLGFWLLHATVTGPRILLGWLLAVTLTTFGYYGYDKWRARVGSRRVPELVLHLLALAGGSVGAYLGMRAFRHKTIKANYRVVFGVILVLQLLILGLVVFLTIVHS
jgi:uncharacterized membrane protein YsdA (DUF1294 family)